MVERRICPKCGSLNVKSGELIGIGILTSQGTYSCDDCGFSSIFFPVVENKKKNKRNKKLLKISKIIKSTSVIKNKEKYPYVTFFLFLFLFFLIIVLLFSVLYDLILLRNIVFIFLLITLLFLVKITKSSLKKKYFF